MKLSSLFNLPAAQKSVALMFTSLLALPALVSAAPNITVSSSISINDKQTSGVFASANVTESGTNNVVLVSLDYSPTNLGTLNLPLTNFNGSSYSYGLTVSGAANAESVLSALVFTPFNNVQPVSSVSGVTFHVSVTDITASTSAQRTTVLNIFSTNDAPVLNASGTTNINDKSTGVTPFQNATLTDVDSGAQVQTLTVTMNQTNTGELATNSASSGFIDNGDFTYTFTGTAAQAQAALRGLLFVPKANALPVGKTATNTFTISDTDGIATVNNSAVKVQTLSANDAPVLVNVPTAHVVVQTGLSTHPFQVTSLLDPDQNPVLTNKNGENLTWSVTLTGASPVGNLVLNGVPIGLGYSSSNDAATASQLLQSLVYQAPNSTITGTNAMTFTITATDLHGATVTSNVFLDVFSVISPPGLTGTQSGQIMNDNTTRAVFSTVGIQSFNGNSVSVLIKLAAGATNDAQGLLVNLGSFTRTINAAAPSVYFFSGTSEGATAAIRSLLFQPTPNRINGSANEAAVFGIQLIDGNITNILDTSTTVIVVPVNDAPAIAGISALALISDSQTVAPFPTVQITDADELGLQPVTATVTLDDPAKGTFSAGSLVLSGFTLNTNNNSYSFTGVPANLTANIRKLVFVPTPGRVPYGLSEITTLTISLNDNHGGQTANGGTQVRVTPVSGIPVVTLPTPQPVSIPVDANIFVFQGVSIADSTTLKVGLTIGTNAGVAVGKFTTNSVAAAGFTNLPNGSYFFSGSASSVTAALQLLDFSPATNFPPGTVTNYFVLRVTNSAPAPVNVTATHGVVLRTAPTSFIVTKLTDYNPSGAVSDSVKAGTLRNAIARAKNNDHITFDIRSAVAGQPAYPAVIRLVAPVVLNYVLTFDGPGAERLSISGDTNANGTADIQLFTVNAPVTMHRLTFTKGYAPFAGGAFEVNELGTLVLSYCAVTDCTADVWGGGVDVNQGSLMLDHCLIAGNRTSSTFGLGGGGISFYTYWPCAILDTTFSTNRQNAVAGLGGGAIYAETADAGTEFDLHILNSTFRDNRDAAVHGTAIRPNVFNTVVQLQNTILADGQGKNIEMDYSGAVVSLGGNISDDATATIFSSGGAATNTFIFHTPQDQVNVPASTLLAALTNNGGPTATFALTTNSPAISFVISNFPGAAFYSTLGTDQRGYFRSFTGNLPDAGAFERGANQRVIIQELRFNPGVNDEQFIEFYVPRDSTNVDFGGLQVLVDGVLRHTFASQWLQPGEALVLFSKDATNTVVPSGVYSQIATNNLLMNKSSGLVSLRNAAGQPVFAADYVGVFAADTNDFGGITANYQSLVLSPSFEGVFLPYQRVVAKEGGSDTNGLANPGYDPTGKPIAIGNAPPLAYANLTATDAHTVLPAINVLGNDVDPDINDVIRVIAVGTNGNVVGITNYSVLGARIVINNLPTTGASVSYDPTASAFLTALPQGSNVVDSFQYSIIDSLNGVDHPRSAVATNVLEIALNLAKATATVTVNVVGVNAAPVPQPDSFATNPKLTTPEDVLLDFTTATNLLANDLDPNSDDNGSTLTIVSLCETNGYVSNRVSIVTALGATALLDVRFDRNESHITYDPRGSAILNTLGLGQSTNDTFYYSVKDRYGVIGTSPVSLRVTGVNDVPTANPDSLATDEDTGLAVSAASLLANDTDPDIGTVLSVTSVTPVSALGASVSISGTNIIYDPAVSATLNALANKEFASDTFTYTATDEHGLASNAVVTVTVAGVNDKPISQPDAYTTDEETLFTTNSLGVLVNDVEPDINGILPDDSFRVLPSTNTTPFGVTVVVNADGSFGFNPVGLFDWLKQAQPTNDAFSYVVMDHSLSIAGDDSFAATTSSTNNLLPVLANDVVLSQAGGAFTIIGVTSPTNGGTVAINAASNAIIYTPLAGYVGTEKFRYAVSDGLGGGDTADVTVTLTASTLYASADAFTVARGTTNSFNILANDRVLPASGAAISITSLGTPGLGGTVSLNGVGPNNLITYTPNPTNPSPFVEAFSYTITSGLLVSTGVVSVTVIDLGNSLAANNDNFTVIAGGGTTPFDVLANDLILPGPNTNLVITAFTSNSVLGTVSLNTAHTRLLYKPSNTVSNHQEPIITYTVADNAGGTATASVSVRVTPSGFIAGDDTFVVVKNSTNTLPVMVNDVILPNLGQTLFISGVGISTNAPNHGGTISINGPGTGLIYAPAANYNGAEDFTYEITDGSPARALGHVHVVVLDNSPAASNPDTFRVDRDSLNNALLVLTNDYAQPKTPGAFTLTGLQTNSVHATVAINGATANNSLLYSPNAGFIGTDKFSYEFTDTLGNHGTNTVTVTVGSLAPRADYFSVLSGSTSNALAVLANDLAYPDTNSVRGVYQVGPPDNGGSASASGDATRIIYTPLPGFTGTEHFSYTLKDDSTNLFTATATVRVYGRGSDRDTNTVTMTVIGVNDVPTIAGSGNYGLTDKQTVQPFATIVLGDLDEYGEQLQTVKIYLDHLDNQNLQNLGGFTQAPSGVFTMVGTPTNIYNALRGIVLVPVENHITVPTTVTTHLLLTVDDGYISTPVTNLTTVAITAVNDSPTTAGALNSSITDKQTVNPFAGIVIADVDDDALQPLTVRIALDHLNNQTLTNLGGFTQITNGLFALTGTPTNLTLALRGIVFVPVENHIIVPTTETTRLTLTVDDNFATTVTNAATTVAITAVNDSPTTAGAGNYNITDKQTVNPFASIVVADVDDDAAQVLTVEISLDHLANQTLTNLGGFTQITNGLFTLTETPTNLTAALRGIVFVPTPNHIPVPTSVTTRLTLLVDDYFAPLVTNALTTVTITATNDAPTFAGSGNYSISDKQTVQPFATIVVADLDDDGLQPLLVRIALDNLDKGTLQNLGGFTLVTNGLFELFGTPTNITAALRAMFYVPVPNHIPVPTTVPIHLTLSADDGFVSAPVTNLTTVSVTASNDAPVISGTVAGQLVYGHSSIKPFVGALITELDNDKTQALRVTITLDNAIKGGLSSLGGFTNLGAGVYAIGVSNGSVTAAIATAAMRGLVFTPTVANRVQPGVNETTRFTIRVDDFFAATVVDSNTTVVAIHAQTAKVTASDKTVNSRFGWSAATTRDLAVIGEPRDATGTQAGSVYLFARSLDGSNTWSQIKKLLPPDGLNADEFGTAVAISGDTIVVGAPLRNDQGTDSGVAYVFMRDQNGANQWGFVKKLLATDGSANNQFGAAVSISGDVVLVGSPLANTSGQGNSGAAYIFTRNQGGSNQWGQFKKLVSSAVANADRFGTAVSISTDTMVVGSPLVGGGSATGAADIYTRNQGGADQWGFVKRIVAGDGFSNGEFGSVVTISGDLVAVSAPLVNTSGLGNSGATYIFSRNLGGANQWGQVKRLLSTDAAVGDHFGSSLALNGESLVVGAQLADASGNDSGVTYLFGQNQGGSNVWGQVDKFLPSAVGASDNFGSAVAISSGTIVVGAYNGMDTGVRYGTAFMFRIKYNNAPQVLRPLVDQTVLQNSPLAYTIPAGTFADPDVNETLVISLGSSPVPPAWLNFDPLAGTFSGTPSVVGNYPAAAVATDSDGFTATSQFVINVIAVPNLAASLSMGFQTIGITKVVVVSLSGLPGTPYKLQRTPSLSGNVIWTDVGTTTADVNGLITFQDLATTGSMFYRAVVAQ